MLSRRTGTRSVLYRTLTPVATKGLFRGSHIARGPNDRAVAAGLERGHGLFDPARRFIRIRERSEVERVAEDDLDVTPPSVRALPIPCAVHVVEDRHVPDLELHRDDRRST